MKVFKKENTRVPIFSWCENPDEGAIEQAVNLSKLPFLYKHVALMPDTHKGYGMPIGGVIACENVVIPNAVGVDIGCGMAAVKTSLTDISTERLKEIMGLIRKKIPVGFNKHSKNQDEVLMPQIIDELPVVFDEYGNAQKQLGTLGGGNHFIEIQKGSDGYIWFMVHSGSRNLGYKVAKHYNELAQDLCKKWHSNIPEYKGEDGLAFLPVDSEEGRAYLREMNFCLDFAKANRDLMVDRIKEAFKLTLCPECKGNGGRKGEKCGYCAGRGEFEGCDEEINNIQFTDSINIHHNYAALENHFGKNLWIHRKGATSAKEGQPGIIPGSQGTSSYIVHGKGNRDSFMSCSHGAGRKMGRKQAQRELNLEDEQKRLNDKGVIHSIRNAKDLDEASGAYKDIDIVMEEQKDLVDIVVKLEPLAVIKG